MAYRSKLKQTFYTYKEIAERASKNKIKKDVIAPITSKAKHINGQSYKHDDKLKAFNQYIIKKCVKDKGLLSVCKKCGCYISIASAKEQKSLRKIERVCRYCLEISKK